MSRIRPWLNNAEFLLPGMTKLMLKIKKLLWRHQRIGYLAVFGLSLRLASLPLMLAATAQEAPTQYSQLTLESTGLPSFYFDEPTINDSPILQNGSFIKPVFLPDNQPLRAPKLIPSIEQKTNIGLKNAAGRIIVTAYSSTPDQTDSSPFITANGTYVYDGLVAANFLPFGTKVKFPEVFGDKVFTVNDRMASRNSHKIDIWMPSRELAMQFGVKRLVVEILE